MHTVHCSLCHTRSVSNSLGIISKVEPHRTQVVEKLPAEHKLQQLEERRERGQKLHVAELVGSKFISTFRSPHHLQSDNANYKKEREFIFMVSSNETQEM